MDISNILVLIVPLVLVIILQFFIKKRQVEKTPMGKVISILTEVRHNQKLTEGFAFNLQAKKFKTGSWKRNYNKIDFLDDKTQVALADAFDMAEDFNQQIDMAKKQKSSSYLATVNVERLRAPLEKSKLGLEEWLQENMHKEEMYPKRRSLFGS